MFFDLYLDAARYCRQHSLPLTRIERKGFRSWLVVVRPTPW